MRVSNRTWVVAALLISVLPRASADNGTADPALGVARVSLANGDVAVRRGDSGDWIAATVNMPVVEGDALQAVGGSRAEVQLDRANFLRLGTDTEVQFLELASRRFRIRVLRGTVLYSELRDGEADVDIETPSAAVRPTKAGRYRIDVASDETVIAVHQGEAEIAFRDSIEVLKRGRTMIVRDGTQGAEFLTGRVGPKDEFDEWAANRDRSLRRARSHAYVSRDIYGVDALDAHGEWRLVMGVGHSWFPSVSIGWVPYRLGRWIWLDYYGWTWVGREPWGWAPYHWGRWFHDATYGWGWYPGVPRLRHVWRPALVAFFGFDHLFGPRIGLGFGGIGWCPLGLGERYVPWYGRRYYASGARTTIVVDNSVNIHNVYRNARGGHAVSYVDSQGFGRAARRTPRALRTADLRQGVAIRGPVPVAPDRASQGRVVQARAAPGSTPRALRTSSSPTLRDGTARIPFEAQRERMRDSIQEFGVRYRTAAARAASNSGVRRSTAPTGTAAGGATTVRPAVGAPARRPSAAGSVARTATSTSTVRSAPPSRTQRPDVDLTQEAAAAAGGARAATARTTSPIPTGLESSSPIRGQRVGSQQQPQGSTGARTRVGAVSASRAATRAKPTASGQAPQVLRGVGSSSSVYAPRTRSRIGGSIGSQGRRRGDSRPLATSSRSAPRTQRPAAPSRAQSPEGLPSAGAPAAGSSATRSNPTPRPPRGVGSSSSVYAPRARSRVGARTSSRGGRAASASGGGTPRPTYAPRTETRVGSGSRSRTNSSGTSVRPAPRTSRSPAQSSSRVYAPSSRSGTRTPSSPPGGRAGRVFSPRSSEPSRSSRSVGGSVPGRSSRSPSRTSAPSRSTRSSGGSPLSSRGSFGSSSRSAPRPSVSRPSVTRSGAGTRPSSSGSRPSRSSRPRR